MKKVSTTLGTFIIYVYFSLVLSLCAKYILHIQLMQSNLEHIYWVNIICDIVFVISVILLNFKVLTNNEFIGKNFWNKAISFILRVILLFFVFMAFKVGIAIILSVISKLFNLSSESNNQAMIEAVVKLHPIGMFASVCLFAPFMEEMIFRGSIRKVITNDYLFICVSGLLFGLVHVLRHQYLIIIMLIFFIFINLIIESKKFDKKKKIFGSIIAIVLMCITIVLSLHFGSGGLINVIKNISISEAVNSISYISMGLVFAYLYKRYNNIYLCMCIHALNNVFGYIIILFTMFLK